MNYLTYDKILKIVEKNRRLRSLSSKEKMY